jgi:hypothetical protein
LGKFTVSRNEQKDLNRLTFLPLRGGIMSSWNGNMEKYRFSVINCEIEGIVDNGKVIV